MGDRTVIGFKKEANAPVIYLYAHWAGAEQYKIAAEAIQAARPRWDHEDYATRIAVSTIVGNDWSEETGYGLSVNEFAMPDRDDVLVVNWAERMVEVHEGDCHEDLKLKHSLGFDIFLSIAHAA